MGTSSLRRQAQLKASRPDLVIHPLRGNVDTRMRKLEEGEYDAIILAAAGLTRLGKTELVKEVLSEEFMCPAAGQGALGIEIRDGDVEMRKHLAFLDDPAARATTTCERALLNKLGGGCQVPIGAFAEMKDGGLQLTAIVARPMVRKFCASNSEAAIRLRLVKRLATLCCTGAQPRFSKRCMVPRQQQHSSREVASCQWSVISSNQSSHRVILSGGIAGFATPESKDTYFGK